MKFIRVVGEDSSKYRRPKSPSGSRTSLGKVSKPNVFADQDLIESHQPSPDESMVASTIIHILRID
jgi:hypothetical protein